MSGPSERPVAGIRFGETMTGQITLGETDPRSGYRNPGAFGVVVRGTIHIEDLGAFLDDPRHEARLSGEVDIPSLGGRFESDSGRFGLFTPTEQARMTHMVYELGVDVGGVRHWFRGHKEIRVAGPWRLWPATTTLLVTLHEGDREGPVVAAGMLRLRLTAFTALLGSLTVTGGVSMWRRWGASGRFTAFFAGGLISTYLLRRRA